MKKNILLIVIALFSSAGLFATSITSQTFNPTKDGSVKQSGDTYVDVNQFMDIRAYLSFNSEIYLDFDLAALTITPVHATLKVYINSVSTSTPFIIAAYGKDGNVITGSINYTNRPVTGQTRALDVYAASDSVGKWIQFDFTDFIKAQNLTTNKLFSFRLAIVSPGSGTTSCPAITIGSKESSYKPQLILSDAPVPGVYEVPYSNINSITSSNAYTALADPINVFNGAGLLPGMFHDIVADSKSWRNQVGPMPLSLTVKLNDPINIKKFHIWNLNWIYGAGLTDYTDRGVKDMEIYVSSSTDDLSAVTNFTDSRWTKVSGSSLTLTRASGTATYAGEDVLISGADDVRWFAFKALNNFAASSYTGLSEVKIYKEIKANVATSNVQASTATSTFNVSSVNGVLSITNIDPSNRLSIYNTQGQLIHSQINKGTSLQLSLSVGIYVVKANGNSVKAVNSSK